MGTKTICIFCASSRKTRANYLDGARQIGRLLATNDFKVQFGGQRNGMMGAIGDAIIENGGRMRGIVVEFMLDQGWIHPGLQQSDTLVTHTLHQRTHELINGTQGCVTMPGGTGTLEELLHIITLKRLGFYNHPIVLMNIDNYFAPFLRLYDAMIAENFMSPHHAQLFSVAGSAEEVLSKLTFDEESAPISTEDGLV